MNKKIYILFSVLALLLTSCEYEFELDVPLSEPVPMIELVDGLQDDSLRFNIYKLYPVGSTIKAANDYGLKSLSLSVDGDEIKVERIAGTSWYKAKSNASAGSRLDISLVMDDLPELRASTTIPQLPKFSLEASKMKEDRYLWNLTVENHSEGDLYAISVQAMFEDWQELRLESTTGNTLLATPCFYSVLLNCWNKSETVNVVDAEMIRDGKIQFETYAYDVEDFKVRLYKLSPETYYYLKARYNQDNNVLAILNLSPPNFAYSNVEGGYGLVGAVNSSEVTLKVL